jgi:hypothetical protein
MSQNDEYFNCRGFIKRSSGCALMFHFDNVSTSSTVLTIQNCMPVLSAYRLYDLRSACLSVWRPAFIFICSRICLLVWLFGFLTLFSFYRKCPTLHELSLFTCQNCFIRRLFCFVTLSSYHRPVTYDKRLLMHQCDIETLLQYTGK